MTVATDRRQQRRQETIEQIQRIAIDVMAADGVAALSLAEVARRMGIRPPSLYKYFPTRLAVYDALFRDGSRQVLAEVTAAMSATEPGLPALAAGLDAISRFCLRNQVVSQLLYWRPVPGFVPSPEAYAPSLELVASVRATLRAAVEKGQLHPDAESDEGEAMLTTLVAGVMSQQVANAPDESFDEGRFTRLLPRLLTLYASAYPPEDGAP
jgi:AcrR family transcriptional regulator